jgi:probable HAF family extracellular repeat protein
LRAEDVNDRGDVLATQPDPATPFSLDIYLWRRGTATHVEPDSVTYPLVADLSERGQVVGQVWSGPPGGASIRPDAFSWRSGRWVQLDDGEGHAWAEAVNDRGQVLGERVAAGDDQYRPAVWDARGGVTVIPPITGRARSVDFNNRGEALLNVEQASGETQAAVWRVGGGVTLLPTLGGPRADARDINDAGEVTGVSLTAEGEYHAFVWRRGRTIDLGSLGGDSEGLAINEAGEVAGWVSDANYTRDAALWTRHGRLVDLGTGGGTAAEAVALNDRGQVVGFSTAPGERHAVLFERGGFVNLDARVSAEAHDGSATAINERGQIVGNVVDSPTATGQLVAVMWTAPPRHGPPH